MCICSCGCVTRIVVHPTLFGHTIYEDSRESWFSDALFRFAVEKGQLSRELLPILAEELGPPCYPSSLKSWLEWKMRDSFGKAPGSCARLRWLKLDNS